MVKITDGHSPWLFDSCCAARHWQIGKVGCPRELMRLGNQDLSAPDTSVCSIPCPVKRKPEDRSVQPVFSHTAHDVCMVMLHGYLFHTFLLLCIAGTEIIRMEVVRHDLGINVKHSLHMQHCQIKKAVGLKVLQISYVLAEKSILTLGETDCILQLGTAGKCLGNLLFQENRDRDIAP